jgi:hypothetical protein
MKGYPSILLLSLYLSITSCNHTVKSNQHLIDTLPKHNRYSANSIEEVSLITLIANPKQYDGHQVRVIGYLNLEFEGNEIYIHKEDYDQSISKNGLWVVMDRDSAQLPRIRQCVKHNVLMEGTFDANNQGHMGASSGAIKNVTRLEVWTAVSGPPAAPTKHDRVDFSNHKSK